ncbi:hypothetical protein DSBG_2719 [Desulfosporosinus sp. BG]|nr:hypothetical protein DSBG_2719 [Desulfosporosinus sp. BG]
MNNVQKEIKYIIPTDFDRIYWEFFGRRICVRTGTHAVFCGIWELNGK